jgi:HEAT repeat protein
VTNLRGRHLAFSFLVGAIAGSFAGVVAVAPNEEPERLAVFDPERLRSARGSKPNHVTVRIPADSDATALADHLSRARFDRDWGRVEGVAQALRTWRSPRRAAAPSKRQEKADGSLMLMDHAYRQEAFLLELEGRENRATAVAAEELPNAERIQRLTELFQAPLVEPGDAQVRADAAYHLGLLRAAPAREPLLRALEDPDPALAELAAEALGRAGDPAATEALAESLARDLDPARRLRAARALALTRQVAEGGRAAEALAKAALEDRELAVRTHAVASLARVDLALCAAAQDALITLTEDPTAEVAVRRACVAAITAHRQVARSLPRDLVVLLERAFESSSPGPLRIELIVALGHAGRPESRPILETALASTQRPREAAALREALAALERRAEDR